MSATATVPTPVKAASKANSDDVILTVADGEMPLAELIQKVSQQAVAVAWARGDIEFGRRTRVVTGNPNITLTREGESLSGVIVEDGIEWTGPKTRTHTSLAKILANDVLPTAPRYRKYVKDRNDQGEEYLRPVVITRDEAIAMTALKVRLTDNGLSELTPNAA